MLLVFYHFICLAFGNPIFNTLKSAHVFSEDQFPEAILSKIQGYVFVRLDEYKLNFVAGNPLRKLLEQYPRSADDMPK